MLLCMQPCVVHPEARIVVHTPASLLKTLQAPFLDRYVETLPLNTDMLTYEQSIMSSSYLHEFTSLCRLASLLGSVQALNTPHVTHQSTRVRGWRQMCLESSDIMAWVMGDLASDNRF